MNEKIDAINRKYNEDLGENYDTPVGKKYINEVRKLWKDSYRQALVEDFGEEILQLGKDWIENRPFMDMLDDD